MHDEVMAAARCLGFRLADSKIRMLARKARNQQSKINGYEKEDLCQGDIGIALVLNELAEMFPEERNFFRDSVEEILATTRFPEFDNGGAFTGVAGFAAAWLEIQKSDLGRDFSESNQEMEEIILDEIVFSPASSYDTGNAFEDYDLISGAAGQLLCLSAVASNGSKNKNIRSATRLLSEQLEAALEPSSFDPLVPSCWVSPENYFLESKSELPLGYVNLGLAHGVPGIIAALSISSVKNLIDLPSVAVEFGTEFLLRAAYGSPLSWGSQLPFRLVSEPSGQASRVAWCYGTPGVAQALAHASVALDDKSLRQVAKTSLENSLSLGYPENALISPTFCHGEAGVIATGMSVFGADRNASQSNILSWHMKKMLSHLDERLLLGVQDVETIDNVVDDSGLLSGASGIVHVLLSYLNPEISIKSTWSIVTATSALE